MNSTSDLRVAILGVGLLGPGLPSWGQGAALLRQPGDWVRQPTEVTAPPRLPATERRRAGTMVRACITVADEALAHSGLSAQQLPTVFTSSSGDTQNCHLLCEALAAPSRVVSPTRFTNSVHNAPAGYWHIATQSMQPSTSLAALDASFGAGLLEAVSQCICLQQPVLLVACDVPYPEPLHAVRPLPDVFGVAFVLAPASSAHTPVAAFSLHAIGDRELTGCDPADLDDLRRHIPAARALPLLQALARSAADDGADRVITLEGLPGQSLALTLHSAPSAAPHIPASTTP